MLTRGDIRRFTRWVRDRMPPRVLRAVRKLALWWGMATARWRLLPEVVVVGAQRSGTTTLFRLLEQHPELVRPTLSKGTGFFDDDFHRGLRWYAAHFPLRITARWMSRGARPRTFECSGYYLFHPLAAERLARNLPGVHVVALLRDPVERAHSAHRHELARGFETEGFEDALALEPERLFGEEERLTDVPGSTSFSHRHHAYAGRSRYAVQVRRLVDELGMNRVHLIEAERFFADPAGEFLRLQDRLGLTPWDCGDVDVWNARPGAGLSAELRARLHDDFVDDDRDLAVLLGHRPIWREEPDDGDSDADTSPATATRPPTRP